MNINKWFNHIFQDNDDSQDNLRLTKDMEDFISSTAFIFGNKSPKEMFCDDEKCSLVLKQYYDALKKGSEYSSKVDELYDIVEEEDETEQPDKVRLYIWKAVTGNTFDTSRDVFDLINAFRLMVNKIVRKDSSNAASSYFILDRRGRIIGIKEEFASRFGEFSGEFDKVVEFFDKIDSMDEDYKPGLVRLILEPNGNGMEQAISLMGSL